MGGSSFPPPARPARPHELESVEDLLTIVGTGTTADRKAALRELNWRGPQPALLDLADDLPVVELRGPLGRAIRCLGADALGLARAWATPQTEHPMLWTAYQVLAKHGDESDLPALLAGWDWLDRRTGHLCGYQDLADGLARMAGPTAQAAVPRLRRAWFSPHTFERAAYLRAIATLDPNRADRLLVEGLWDCESDVRQFAAQHARLGDMTRDQLCYLRDDPLETSEVRATAAARLT